MFKLGRENKSLYALVEEMFLSEENLKYLQQYTDLEPIPKSYRHFINTNLSLVSISKTPEENLKILNSKVLSKTINGGSAKTVMQRISSIFMSRNNIDAMCSVFEEYGIKKEVISFDMFMFKPDVDESEIKSIEEGIESMNYMFIKSHKRKYMLGDNTSKSSKSGKSGKSGKSSKDTGCDDNFYVDELLQQSLYPAGYESLNKDDKDDPVMERSLYKIPKNISMDPNGYYYTNNDDDEIPTSRMPEYGSNEYLRRQRYDEFQSWQTTDRKIFRDVEETLGQGEREMGNMVRKQKKISIRKAYPTKFNWL